jgi:nickel-dependent lactate racemase
LLPPPSTAAASLASQKAPTGRICIAIPDSTRRINLKEAFSALENWISPSANATVLVGLGLHRNSTKKELADLRALSPWPVQDHDPLNCIPFENPTSLPSALPKAVLEADALVAIGVVELHQYAGFSGGHKAFVVGCGSADSIGALHHRDLITQPGVQVGKVANNPFRNHIDQVGEKLPPCTALQWLPGLGWIAGEPTSTLQRSARLIQPFSPVERRYKTAIITVPSTKTVNFYQASRAATYLALSPNPPLYPGAKIILRAKCPEGIGRGIGELNCANALKSCKAPWDSLLSGPFEWGGGAQRAVMLARLAQQYTLLISDCESADELRALGLNASAQAAEKHFSGEALHVSSPFKQLPQYNPGAISKQ